MELVFSNGGKKLYILEKEGSKWYDHKNQQGGDTIGFLQEFMGYSFRDAVEELLNGDQGNMNVDTTKQSGSKKV